MKPLLRKIFFWDAPAQGAFFGLTLLLFLGWVCFTLLCAGLAIHSRRISMFDAPHYLYSFTLLLPSLYILFLVARVAFHWARETPDFKKRIGLTLLVTLAIAFFFSLIEYSLFPRFISSLDWTEERFTFFYWNVFFLCIPAICFLFRSIVPPTKLLAGILAWIGSFLVFSTLLFLADPFEEKVPTGLHPIHWFGKDIPYVLPFCYLFRLSGGGCFWFTLVGFVLLGAAYLLTGHILARLSGIQLRRLFTRGIRIQWYIVAGTYAVTFTFSVINTFQYHRAVQELEAFFGRAMTGTEVEKLYYGGETPEPDYWKKLKAASDRYDEEHKKHISFDDDSCYLHPDAILPLKLYERHRNAFFASLKEACLDELLASPLPPYQRDYSNNYIAGITSHDLYLCDSLAMVEESRCRYAIDDGDFNAAAKSLGIVDTLMDYLYKDPFELGEVYLRKTAMRRNNMLARIISSHLETPREWLEEQAVLLLRWEETMMRSEKEKNLVFCEAVAGLNMLHCLAESDFGSMESWNPETEACLKYSSIRFFFPQAWWLAAKSAKDYARAMKASRLDQLPKETTGSVFVDMIASNLGSMIKARKHFIASSRVLRSLLMAELHKRQTGVYPDTLEELPPDPFTDKPLQYRKGDCKVIRYHCKWLKHWEADDTSGTGEDNDETSKVRGYWTSEPQEETVEAVQIWSVGPNGIDDGGLNKKAEYGSGQKSTDDIRFIIPIR